MGKLNSEFPFEVCIREAVPTVVEQVVKLLRWESELRGECCDVFVLFLQVQRINISD